MQGTDTTFRAFGEQRRAYAEEKAESYKMKQIRQRLTALYHYKLEQFNERRANPKLITIPDRLTPKNLSAVMGLSKIDILKVAIKCGVRRGTTLSYGTPQRRCD